MKYLTLVLALAAFLLPVANAQTCLLPDGFEPDNTCQTASSPGNNFCQFGLSTSPTDIDWFSWPVAPGEALKVSVRAHDTQALMAVSFKDGCSNSTLAHQGTLGFDAKVEWQNTTGANVTVKVRVNQSSATVACTFYDITGVVVEATVGCGNDAFEPNNCCDIAADLPFTQNSLTLQAGDDDWYRVGVPVNRLLELHALAGEPVSLTLWADCFATFVDSGQSHASVTNASSSLQFFLLQVKSSGSTTACFSYELVFDLWATGQGFCVANGSGCITCPCGNDATTSPVGGCMNGAGESARLLREGLPSASNPTLNFQMRSGNPLSFAILTSGDGVAPNNPSNPCFGTGSGVRSAFLDGLRCVVGSTLRHGGRSCDSNGDIGLTNNRWGPPNGPAIGLLAQGGFVAGQSRYWQATYREVPTLGCGTGLNTTQGILTVITP